MSLIDCQCQAVVAANGKMEFFLDHLHEWREALGYGRSNPLRDEYDLIDYWGDYHHVCKIKRCHWWPATPVAKHLAYRLLVLDDYGLLNGIDKTRA